jgi:hypothetical protein
MTEQPAEVSARYWQINGLTLDLLNRTVTYSTLEGGSLKAVTSSEVTRLSYGSQQSVGTIGLR